MRRASIAAGRRLVEAVAAGNLAVILASSPKLYGAWAWQIGSELARLRLIGTLVTLDGALDQLERGIGVGASRLMDGADAVRGLLTRLVEWRNPSENLPAPVVVAAQGCWASLRPSLSPATLFLTVVAHPSKEARWPVREADPIAHEESHNSELGLVLQRMRAEHGAISVLLLDGRGNLIAHSTVDGLAEEDAVQWASLTGSEVGLLAPEVLAAMPRPDWSLRVTLEDGTPVIACSLGLEANLLVIGGKEALWTWVQDPASREMLEILTRRHWESMEQSETQRASGRPVLQSDEPFR